VLLRLSADAEQVSALAAEHAHWRGVLTRRADALDTALKAEGFEGVPWDGGFFVTVPMSRPREVTDRLMNEGVFVVPIPEGLRLGICGLREADASRVAAALRASHAAPLREPA
jgi:aspartate/tyrosine/aromatic aminotransferase